MNDVPEIPSPLADVAVDRQKLRVMKSFLEETELIASATIVPTTHEPRLVRATIDDEFAPPSRSFYLISEWYLDEEFVVRLLETGEGSNDVYRWDSSQDDSSLETGFKVPGKIRRDRSFQGSPTRPVWIGLSIVPEIKQYLSTL
jgi:hypothetical protein